MRTRILHRSLASVLSGALVVASPFVLAQQSSTDDPALTQGSAGAGGYGPGWGMGPGMMGYGPGMNGYGMMGPGMMGPGMGGYGMGPGGYGMGPGMMGGGGGFGPLGALNLNDDQQSKINSIQENLRKQHWSLAGQIHEQQALLRDLYAAEQTDTKKVGEAYDKIGKLQRQMAESHAQAFNEIRGTLTPEQRKQLSQFHRRGRAMGGPGYGGMMGWW